MICFLIHLKTTWSWAFFFFFFWLLLLCIGASLINNKLAIKSKPYVLNFHLLSRSITLLFRTTIIRIVVSLSLSVSQILGFNTALLQWPNLSLRSAEILDSQKGWFCSWWRCFLLTPADEHSGEGRDLMSLVGVESDQTWAYKEELSPPRGRPSMRISKRCCK